MTVDAAKFQDDTSFNRYMAIFRMSVSQAFFSKQRSPTSGPQTGTGPWPVQNGATRQEGSSRRGSEPVPGAEKVAVLDDRKPCSNTLLLQSNALTSFEVGTLPILEMRKVGLEKLSNVLIVI